jgi:hypothetical protein
MSSTLTLTSVTQQTATTEMTMMKNPSTIERMQSMQWTEMTQRPAVLKLWTKSFFFSTFESNLLFLFFVGVSNIVLLVLAMVSPKNECLGATVCLQWWG